MSYDFGLPQSGTFGLDFQLFRALKLWKQYSGLICPNKWNLNTESTNSKTSRRATDEAYPTLLSHADEVPGLQVDGWTISIVQIIIASDRPSWEPSGVQRISDTQPGNRQQRLQWHSSAWLASVYSC